MARKRQVDPEYPFEEEIALLSIPARYFYIMSWCHMDDTNGVLPYNVFKLKGQIFPNDDIDVEVLIQELVSLKRLIPFEANNKKWLWCPKLLSHQVINHPSKRRYPDPPKELKEDYRSGKLVLPQSRVELVEKSRVIKDSATQAEPVSYNQSLLDTVYKKGFNIYSLINKFKKERGIDLPPQVIDKVCGYFVDNTDKIEDHWAWFIVSVKKASEEYFVKKNIRDKEEGKKLIPSIKEIMKNI